jgi:hypothetical protein
MAEGDEKNLPAVNAGENSSIEQRRRNLSFVLRILFSGAVAMFLFPLAWQMTDMKPDIRWGIFFWILSWVCVVTVLWRFVRILRPAIRHPLVFGIPILFLFFFRNSIGEHYRLEEERRREMGDEFAVSLNGHLLLTATNYDVETTPGIDMDGDRELIVTVKNTGAKRIPQLTVTVSSPILFPTNVILGHWKRGGTWNFTNATTVVTRDYWREDSDLTLLPDATLRTTVFKLSTNLVDHYVPLSIHIITDQSDRGHWAKLLY